MGGAAISLHVRSRGGRMRYAPTVFGKMDWGRAKTAEGTFQLKELIPRRSGTFYLQKFLPRRTGTFWCCKLTQLVGLVLFDEYFYNVKTYLYFLMCEKTYFYRY